MLILTCDISSSFGALDLTRDISNTPSGRNSPPRFCSAAFESTTYYWYVCDLISLLITSFHIRSWLYSSSLLSRSLHFLSTFISVSMSSSKMGLLLVKGSWTIKEKKKETRNGKKKLNNLRQINIKYTKIWGIREICQLPSVFAP